MTHLSVNINKIATLRNSRGGNNPDVVQWALDIERMGADGITVHPRPDERHIRYDDARQLSRVLSREFNIEGNPREEKFVALVLECRPAQVTLVPDAAGQLTSNHGWDVIGERTFLREMVETFKSAGIRTSVFVDPDARLAAAAADTGVDRIELYTEAYASGYAHDRDAAIAPYIAAAAAATAAGLALNAGHDLDLHNLAFFAQSIPALAEVSIGHALIADALRWGMENVVQQYQRALGKYYPAQP